MHCSKLLVCTAVVSGLDNFAVGMPDVFPTEGSAVDTNSYTVCGTVNINATKGSVVHVDCPSFTQQFRYVIVQSLDTVAERLCIAEVAVYCRSTYMQNYVHVGATDCHVFDAIFGRPIVKRFALCYRTVLLTCLSVCMYVCDVGVLWPNG